MIDNGISRFASYDLIVFDFDGTLFYLDIDWNELRQKLRSRMMEIGGEDLEFNPMVDTIEDVRRKNETTFQILRQLIDEYETQGHRRPNPPLIEALKTLHNMGKKTAILTLNTRAVVNTIMKEYDLNHYVDTIICFEDVSAHKPEPEGLEKIMKEYNASSTSTLLIGDSLRDRECALSIGADYLHPCEISGGC